MSAIASVLVRAVKFMKSFAVVTSIRIFCRLLLRCPCSNFAQHVISSSFDGNDYILKFHRNPLSIRAKVIKNANVGTGHRDRPRDTVRIASAVDSLLGGIKQVLHTTLFAIKGSNNKNQKKQRKSSKIKHCKISQTQQNNIIQQA